VLGRGSFGKVFLVQKKSNKKYYALKTLKKEEILQRGHIDNALSKIHSNLPLFLRKLHHICDFSSSFQNLCIRCHNLFLAEKNVLQHAHNPFVVRLRYSFQNDTTLYLVMDFCPGGELFNQLKKKGRFDEESTKFYAAETILALQYLHEELDIIYR